MEPESAESGALSRRRSIGLIAAVVLVGAFASGVGAVLLLRASGVDSTAAAAIAPPASVKEIADPYPDILEPPAIPADCGVSQETIHALAPKAATTTAPVEDHGQLEKPLARCTFTSLYELARMAGKGELGRTPDVRGKLDVDIVAVRNLVDEKIAVRCWRAWPGWGCWRRAGSPCGRECGPRGPPGGRPLRRPPALPRRSPGGSRSPCSRSPAWE
jgi:hypothetical protein